MASLNKSSTSTKPLSRPRTPDHDSPPRPPPLTRSPPRSPPLRSSPEPNSYIGHSTVPLPKPAQEYLSYGSGYSPPQMVPNSSLPSSVPSDSSSIAALDSQVNQDELRAEVIPSPALEAREKLEKTAAAAKYGVHTKSASDGADVRWYFCKTPLRPNEAAAQVPASEVVGKGDYFRFSIRDSLALEAAFVMREEELVSAWWKEYAEVSEGPVTASGRLAPDTREQREVTKGDVKSLSRTSSAGKDQIPYGVNNPDSDDGESVGVLVKGGLYEVDLMLRRCIPVYWRGEHRRVLRGHWYVRKGGLDWLPLREDVAEQLEIAYHSKIWRRRAFQPSGLYAARVNLTGTSLSMTSTFYERLVNKEKVKMVKPTESPEDVLNTTFEGLHALFMGEDDTWEATLAVDASGISLVLGLKGNGVKLRRGFAPPDSLHPTQDELRQRKEEELDDYASQVPVRHVVFMVHGIGQRLEKANLVDDVGTFRRTVSALSEHHLTPHQRNAQRILFIPCQWRRELKLGGEVAMENITLEGVRALRTMITATVHDVLYYMSPVYCQDIIDSVTKSLNRLYTKFIKRNPTFDGKVSLYGHSLGSVLTYDILCHQDTLTSAFPVQNINDSMLRNDETEDEFPKIDRLPAAIENDSGSEDGSLVQNSDISGPESTPSESGCVGFSGVVSNAGRPDNSEETREKEALKEIETVEKEKARLDEVVLEEEENSEEVKFSDQDASQEGLQAARKERIFDKVVEGAFATSRAEPSEAERLKSEVAALQEKLRILERNEGTNITSQRYTADAGATFGNRQSFESLETQESQSHEIADERTGPESTGHDGSILRQSTSGKACTFEKGSGFESIRESTDPSFSSRKQHRPFIIYPKLKFQVDTFYAVGSPLGMFLALRNIRLGIGTGLEYWQDEGIDEEMPACRLLLNIFHPYDPVAYRLEPLVCKEYVDKRPVFIPYHKGGKRLHIGLQEFSEDLSMKSKAFVSSIGSVGTRVAHVFTAKHHDDSTDEEEREKNRKKPKTYGQLVMERLTGSPNGRIDCMLQDSTFEHQYISAISSHTSYWQDPDTALFILKHLYRDISEEPVTDNVTTMEPLPGTIDDDPETPRPESPETPPPMVRIQDDWDSGDEDSGSSLFFSKEEFVAVLSAKNEDHKGKAA